MKRWYLLLCTILLATGIRAQEYTTLPRKEAEKVVKYLTKREQFIVTADLAGGWGGAPELIAVSEATAEKTDSGYRILARGHNRQQQPVSGYLDLNEVWVKSFDRATLIGRKLKLGKISKRAKADKRLFFWNDISLSERAPEYLPDETALFDFIRETMRNPSNSSRKEVIGRVGVKFTVTAFGKVKNPWIVESVGPEQDEEVLRVIRLIPERWKPAYKDGQYIDSEFYVRVPVKAY